MNSIARLGFTFASGIGLIGVLAAASSPAALSGAEAGLWEVSRSGLPHERICVPAPAALAQLEHRQAKCESSVVRDSGAVATIHYTCTDGGYGHSSLTLVTPRSLRVETQGISANAPFKYTFQARRVGNC